MKKIQNILAGFATLAVAASAYAVAPQTTFYAAGSSAQFPVFAVAAVQPNSFCGTNYWASGSNAVTLVDPRNSNIAAEPGNIWITWNTQAAAGQSGGFICYFVSVDSIVGLREYFANSTLSIPASLVGSASSTKLNAAIMTAAGGTAVALPAGIQSAINGTKLNAGVTDIRVEDAKFASNRVLTSYGSFMTGRFFTGVGYQPTTNAHIGTPIQSSQSTTTANPVDFEFYWQGGATDPFTGNQARFYREADIGGAPVVVFINTGTTGAGHLGDGTFTNINHFLLANVLDGFESHTSALSTVPNEPDQPLHVWIREPLSGTYNTTDFNVGNTLNIGGDYAQASGKVTGMETGITTTNVACAGHQPCSQESGNPLYHIFSNGGTRGRAIGSGELITAVRNHPDSIGFSFWNFNSFAGTSAAGTTQIKYLDVDGVDPIYSDANPNPNGVGVFPTCTASPCNVPLDNVKNGSYPIWTKYRLVYDYTDNTNVTTNVVSQIPAASAIITDLVPAFTASGAYNLQVFRSHSAQVIESNGTGEGPNNGYYTNQAGNTIPETGGDMGGAVLTISSELDFINDTGGNQQVGLKN